MRANEEAKRGWGLGPVVMATALLAAMGCGPNPSAFSATAVNVTGRWDLKAGDACRLWVEPAQKLGVNCRITLRCGHVEVYGGERLGGYAMCDTDEQGFATVAAEDGTSPRDGDPTLDFDAPAGTITVTDVRPRSWAVTATFEAADVP